MRNAALRPRLSLVVSRPEPLRTVPLRKKDKPYPASAVAWGTLVFCLSAWSAVIFAVTLLAA